MVDGEWFGDSNRFIWTLPIMALIQTANENSTSRLLKSVATFLSYVAEEYKVMVLRSHEEVCIHFPDNHIVIVGFVEVFQ